MTPRTIDTPEQLRDLLDEDGRVVVVDLKTGKYPPTGPEVEKHAQLGLYQLAVEHGAADETAGHPVESGGAELVQLRIGEGLPKIQMQSPQPRPAGGVRLIEEQLMQAASTLRSEEFVARPGGHCERCTFQAICPDKAAGTVLS